MLGDTIAAVATGQGRAAIGIVRLSGADAIPIADRLFRSQSGIPLAGAQSHRLYYGRLVATGGAVVDECLAVAMRGPGSFTGEDVVEFQCHGSPVVLRGVLRALIAAGARAALPGEFTRRAFINGRLDLTQVEAIADLLEAQSERAGAVAAGQLGGSISSRVAAIREALVGFLAHIHGAVDYPDEVVDVAPKEWVERLQALVEGMEEAIEESRRGIRVREGVDVVLVGRPNVGKSSLLNALLRTPRAIVTEVAGTTRDVIEEGVEIGGVAFRLSDTAGLREAGDVVERMGVAHTMARVAGADLLLAVFDASEGFGPEDAEVLRLARGGRAIAVMNKADLPERLSEGELRGLPVVRVSAKEGRGLVDLEAAMVNAVELGDGWSEDAERLLLTRPRQVGALQGAAQALRRAISGAGEGVTPDCLALEVEDALWHLGELTGETTPEEVVSEIFRRFCVGK